MCSFLSFLRGGDFSPPRAEGVVGPSAGEVKKAMRTEIDSMEAEIAEMESSLKNLSGKALRYSAVGRMRQKSAAARGDKAMHAV